MKPSNGGIIKGAASAWQGNAESPGSDGASPYLAGRGLHPPTGLHQP